MSTARQVPEKFLAAALAGAVPTVGIRVPEMPCARSAPRREFVLCPRLEIAGVVALAQLARRLALHAVHHPPALHGRALEEGIGPTLHVFVFLNAQEFGGIVGPALCETTVPGEDC